jgi:hypothetical protein
MVDIAFPFLDKTIPIVTVKQNARGEWEGTPSPAYQRWWQNAKITLDLGSQDVTTKVTKLTYDVYVAPTAAGSYSQVQMQTLMNAVAELSQKMKV